MSAKSQIVTDIDYEKMGKQQGSLYIPYSRNNSAWANLLIPITAVRNGSGPTMLALAGTHGDEFEGPVALMKLARELKPEDVSGRVVIIPALNLPAIRAGTRLSPVDGVNLNRAFPGRYNDSPTGLIAHYLTNILFPLADIVMDIHSGGQSLNFFPCSSLHRVPDDSQFERMLAAAKAWGAPYVFIYMDIAGGGLLPVQAEQMGKVVVTTEMGGAGQCSPEVLRITERGIRKVMIHGGLLEGEPDLSVEDVRVVASTERDDHHLSPADGIYESCRDVGVEVNRGEVLGWVHSPERNDRPPEPVCARTSGILMCRRFPGLTSRGDCVAVIARPIPF